LGTHFAEPLPSNGHVHFNIVEHKTVAVAPQATTELGYATSF
jgi:hypothetical protein